MGNSFSVKVTISKGKEFTLQHSPGWDIPSGKVVIDEVIAADAMNRNDLLNWMEIHSQSIHHSNKYEDNLAILEDIRKMCQEPWVLFHYTELLVDGVYVPAMDTNQVIPGYLFAEHIKGF